jgi:DNA-binding CsgD family transcriptional regulator
MDTMSLRGDPTILLHVLDSLDVGLAFFEPDGTPLHRTRAMHRLLSDPIVGRRLDAELHALLHGMVARVARGDFDSSRRVQQLDAREVQEDGARYRLQASYIGSTVWDQEEALVLTVERLPTGLPSADAIREQFGLSAQEARIARMLAEGRSNAEIAAGLFISPHTARNHTRHVLEKLRVRSRAQVGGRLRSSHE